MENIQNINKKRQTLKASKKKKDNLVVKLFPMAQYDPATGEKIAESPTNESELQNRRLAYMEMMADARNSRKKPVSAGETARDSLTGSGLGLLAGHVLISKDSPKLKWLTAMRKKGLMALGGATLAGAASALRQKSEYNTQQAAREVFSKKPTERAKAYLSSIKEKYNIGNAG